MLAGDEMKQEQAILRLITELEDLKMAWLENKSFKTTPCTILQLSIRIQ